jgi:hypothetical protein
VSIEIDISQPGVVFSRFDGEQTAEDLERYIAAWSAVHTRGQPWVGINYMRRYARNKAITERMGRWLKDTEAVTRRLCLGAAIICTSPAFRFILGAVFLVKPMPCPYVVSASTGEAIGFVRERAAAGGLTLPSTLALPWNDSPP